jgi:hypothetical protein
MRFELLMVLGNQFSLKLNDFLCSFIIPHRNWQFCQYLFYVECPIDIKRMII